MHALILAAVFAGGDGIFTDSFEVPVAGECQEIEGFTRSPIVYVENLNLIAQTYEDLFGPWSASSNTLHIRMAWMDYASVPFTLGSKRQDDNVNILWELLHGNPEKLRISVSRCQGPPTPESAVPQTGIDTCYIVSNGSIGGFSMTVAGKESASIECVLEPGNYYLNFGWIDANGDRACKSSTCVWNVKAQ